MSSERNKSIPSEAWNGYVTRWPLGAVFGIESRYETYEFLDVYAKTWESTRTLLERSNLKGGRALNLGVGPAANELMDINKINQTESIVAADNSEGMLMELRKRLDDYPEIKQKVDIVRMNAGSSWPEEMGSFDLILSNTMLCWMSEDEREIAISEVGRRLNDNGVAILQFRTNDWDEAVVKKHIPDELRKIGPKVIFAAFGARKGFTQKVAEMIEMGEVSLVRPTEKEIISLAQDNGMVLKDRLPTFWPGENEKDFGNKELGHGAALLFEKRNI